jgi:hypothetical protein
MILSDEPDNGQYAAILSSEEKERLGPSKIVCSVHNEGFPKYFTRIRTPGCYTT